MANTKSARKAVRRTTRRTAINKARRTRLRTYVRSVEDAIEKGDKKAAAEALKLAEPVIMSSAQKNVVHKLSASRKVSRLSARVRAMQG